MALTVSQQRHFKQAVGQLGDRLSVVARHPIFNVNGIKILDQGARIDGSTYQLLMQHRLAAPIERSVGAHPCVTSESLRQGIESFIRETPFFGRIAAERAMRASLVAAVAGVPMPDPVGFQLTVAHELYPAIYQHLLRTSLVCAWLTSHGTRSQFEMGQAAAAGLLHNLGMLHVDPALMQRESVLDRGQRQQLYTHALVSTGLLEKYPQYDSSVVRAIAEHHECLDGSGYPRHLRGAEISVLGQTLSLSAVVATVFATGQPAAEVQLSVLLRMSAQRYDAALVKKVTAHLRPGLDGGYPQSLLLDGAVGFLDEIDALLQRWPLKIASDAAVSERRRGALASLHAQAAQILRAMAGGGVLSAQLSGIDPSTLDVAARTELSLVTREAAWQLRSLARLARRRWHAGADEAVPDELQQWLEAADGVFYRVTPGELTDGLDT